MLMKKRTQIHTLIKRLNEGQNDKGKQVADIYQDECAELYQKMMKSLSQIKIPETKFLQLLLFGSFLLYIY